MATEIQNGTMMVREGFLLPDSSQIESLSYSRTWRTMTGLDSFAVERKLHSAGWRLFFIAGELGVVEFGWGASAVRRAVKRLLNRGCKSNLNCMQIPHVGHVKVPGLPFVTIRACLFHIQKDAFLASNMQREAEQQDRRLGLPITRLIPHKDNRRLTAAVCNHEDQENNMRSEYVFAAAKKIGNRFMLCRVISVSARSLQVNSKQPSETINKSLRLIAAMAPAGKDGASGTFSLAAPPPGKEHAAGNSTLCREAEQKGQLLPAQAGATPAPV